MKKKRVEVKERRENQGKNYSRTKAIKEKGKRFFLKKFCFSSDWNLIFHVSVIKIAALHSSPLRFLLMI